MKKRLLGATLAVGALLASGPALAEGELNLFNWGNYTSPELIEAFEKEYDIKVNLDGYDSNEAMLAKVQAGASGYDLVVPSDYMVAIMIEEGLLAEVDASGFENFGNIKEEFLDVYWDPGRKYSVPYLWGTTGISVNTEGFDGDINTYDIVFDPPEQFVGRINMLSEMGAVLGAGLFYLGYEQCNGNTDQLKELNDLLTKSKEKWRTIEYGTIEKLTSGDVAVSQNWNGASMRARLQVPTVAYAYPKEGVFGWADNVAMLKDAPNPENAKLFMDFILRPESAAQLSNFARYANSIEGSEEFMDPEMASAPEIVPPAGAPTPTYVPPCPSEVNDLYTKIWNNLLK